jgi:hypothetical protein
MKRYTVILKLCAKRSPWPYIGVDDHEFEFEHDTRLILIEEPKYYVDSKKQVKFRVEGGTREYFTELGNFLQNTEPI